MLYAVKFMVTFWNILWLHAGTYFGYRLEHWMVTCWIIVWLHAVTLNSYSLEYCMVTCWIILWLHAGTFMVTFWNIA